MTDEEKKAQKEAIAEAVKAAVSGMNTKNKELLQEVKDAKTALTEFAGVDIKSLKLESDELAKLKKAKDEADGNYKKLYDALQTQHADATKKLTDDLKTSNDLLASERKTNSLTKSLVENHVDPILVDSAALILSDKVAVNDKGESMVGEVTVADFVKDWAAGDVGKRFVTDANSGGDANGPGGKKNADAAFYDPNSPKFNRTEQAKIANRDVAAHTAFVKSAPVKKAPAAK